MKGICCKCEEKKNVLIYKKVKRKTFYICHDCIRAEEIYNLKHQGVYGLIMSYPFSGIPRSEKHSLCEWLMKEQGDIK